MQEKTGDFLSNATLYESQIIFENYGMGNVKFYDPRHFKGSTFQYFCENEIKDTTFELELLYDSPKWSYNQLGKEVFKDGKLNYTFPVICKCRSCHTEKVYFLLNVFSNNKISDIVGVIRPEEYTERSIADLPDTNIFVQKVGIYPEQKINLNKEIVKFLNRENNKFYFKGVKSLHQNYGVGSLAYFRRIVESELIHIVELIKELPDSNKSMIQKLIDEHEKDDRISTIYDNIYQYLPQSLKSLGDNPIKMLYNLSSGGLHSFTEEEALSKAKGILKLLEFVILKINEEKSVINDIKNIIKDLKK